MKTWWGLHGMSLGMGIVPQGAALNDERRWLRGRKLGAEDLQLVLLMLLDRQPSHGYELIKSLDVLSNGYYKPSPGVLYPALSHLETAGLAVATRDGAKKNYRLTTAGADHLAHHADRVEALLQGLRHASKKMVWLRQALGEQPRVSGPQGEDLATGWLPVFVEARMALRAALTACTDASPEAQRRIAHILLRAAADIERAAPAVAPAGIADPMSKQESSSHE